MQQDLLPKKILFSLKFYHIIVNLNSLTNLCESGGGLPVPACPIMNYVDFITGTNHTVIQCMDCKVISVAEQV